MTDAQKLKKHIESLSVEDAHALMKVVLGKKLGWGVQTNDDPGSGGLDTCKDHTGCANPNNYVNYDCELVNGVCTAVPTIG